MTGTLDATYDNDFRVTSLTVNKTDPAALAVAFVDHADSLPTKAGNLNLTRNAQNGLLTGSSLGTVTDTRAYNGFGEATAYNASIGASALLMSNTATTSSAALRRKSKRSREVRRALMPIPTTLLVA